MRSSKSGSDSADRGDNGVDGTSAERFWKWFKDHGDMFDSVDSGREAIFDSLEKALRAVHPDLTFEFGPTEDGRREFVVSAGGHRGAFPAVRALVAAAPELPRFRVVAFRQRQPRLNDMVLEIGGVRIEARQVRFLAEADRGNVGITLLLPGYRETTDEVFEQAGYLLLDQALGEETMETRVGFVEIVAPSEKLSARSSPLHELARVVDEWGTRA